MLRVPPGAPCTHRGASWTVPQGCTRGGYTPGMYLTRPVGLVRYMTSLGLVSAWPRLDRDRDEVEVEVEAVSHIPKSQITSK